MIKVKLVTLTKRIWDQLPSRDYTRDIAGEPLGYLEGEQANSRLGGNIFVLFQNGNEPFVCTVSRKFLDYYPVPHIVLV